jgi:hypothetical protein
MVLIIRSDYPQGQCGNPFLSFTIAKELYTKGWVNGYS